jgi:cellulose 1,4-beta-cellobiosidase
MDIWEANSISNAVTPHTCDQPKQTMCTAPNCGGTYGEERYAGPCDPDGCDFNPFRMGNESFYGPGKIVDTNSKLTVVTQFITDDGTSSGTLSEIRRFYAQNGKVIPQSESTVQGVPGNDINEEFCLAQKEAFGDPNTWKQHGGFPAMSEALSRGMVLVMSLWDDYYAHMLWLDSDYPVDADPSKPGVSRGTCPTDSGVPSEVESKYPDSHVVFSNIKVGPLGSTFGSGGSGGSGGSDNPGGSSTTSSSAGGPTGGSGTAGHWEQCGGQGWSGPTTCASPYTCVKINDYYSQCQ